ncbi:uncharacterized protein METZ01_LOCUS199147 [marine metagenome]|uniref:Uncharacterized protein n=1 Tax=marine metagenome TaxID=408172 RepID=A0A382E8H5_9ZZZZ
MSFRKIVEGEARVQKVLKILNNPKYLLTMNWFIRNGSNKILLNVNWEDIYQGRVHLKNFKLSG